MYFGMFVHLVCNTSNQKKKKKLRSTSKTNEFSNMKRGSNFGRGYSKTIQMHL